MTMLSVLHPLKFFWLLITYPFSAFIAWRSLQLVNCTIITNNFNMLNNVYIKKNSSGHLVPYMLKWYQISYFIHCASLRCYFFPAHIQNTSSTTHKLDFYSIQAWSLKSSIPWGELNPILVLSSLIDRTELSKSNVSIEQNSTSQCTMSKNRNLVDCSKITQKKKKLNILEAPVNTI